MSTVKDLEEQLEAAEERIQKMKDDLEKLQSDKKKILDQEDILRQKLLALFKDEKDENVRKRISNPDGVRDFLKWSSKATNS